MNAVWIALAAIFAFEVWALLTHRPTWSVIIRSALQGHPIKAAIVFGIVVLIAGHVLFGWFNRHHHVQPAPTYDGY